MEILKKLFTRLRHAGVLLLAGLLLIIYAGLGVVYFQQSQQQKSLQKQIAQLSPVLAKPMPSSDELKTEYEKVKGDLLPMTNIDAIARLVDIARNSGIEVEEDIGKLQIPPATSGTEKVGEGTYKLLSFRGVQVQGDYEKVKAFIFDLDSGKTLKNIVLKRVTMTETTAVAIGEEGQRRAEFRNVAAAVLAMMIDNNLDTIPKPLSYDSTLFATNLIGDDPNTEDIIEGFPNITTTASEKGYTGLGSPRGGYVLYNHDKISTANTTLFQTVSYIALESTQYYSYSNNYTTQYYYTSEEDGTVRQFSEADLIKATEYKESSETKIETVATVDIDIYFRP